MYINHNNYYYNKNDGLFYARCNLLPDRARDRPESEISSGLVQSGLDSGEVNSDSRIKLQSEFKELKNRLYWVSWSKARVARAIRELKSRVQHIKESLDEE